MSSHELRTRLGDRPGMRVFKKKVLLRNQSWKNKKRRRRERTRDGKPQPNNIPLDLTVEILSRLPAKSIIRYRSVSKLWSSVTLLPSFINSFTFRSSERPPRLLLTFVVDYKQVVISFPQNQNPDGSYSPVYGYHRTGIYDFQYPQSHSVQGLILLSAFQIWNPSLRRVLTLPRPKEPPTPISRSSCKLYLGYDPLDGKHKVLYLLYGSNNYVEPLILTLGGQESWRIITKGRCPSHSPAGVYGRCLGGVLYYEARVDGQHIIMSFDFKSESFSPIKYLEDRSRKLHMIHYEGRLALVTDTFAYADAELYILKDKDGHEWTRHRLPRLPCKSEWRRRMQFKGIADAGELVFAAPRSTFVGSFYILYFDPRRNTQH